MLPPDLRSQVEGQKGGHRGIGGGAKENAHESAARARAMGDTTPAEEPVATKAEEKKPETKIELCPNPRCKNKIADEHNFCPRCGRDLLMDKDPVKALGIEPFTEEDVEDYIFKGFIVRDVKILGKHKLTLKSSQGTDMKAVDAYLVDGEYKEKQLSVELHQNLKSMATCAACTTAFDGLTTGKELEDRVKWLEEKGSAFIDMVTRANAAFNRAWTKYLEEKNSILGF